VAAQHGGEVLLGDEAGLHHAAVVEHDGEQPDDPLGAGSSSQRTLNWAKSTCGWRAGGVSKRRSKGGSTDGRTVRRKSATVE
jgi:hypothetical protein